jgi:GT2 family glycosyltransferase
MAMDFSLDVLVPSFRLDTGPLLAILDLSVPSRTRVRWIIVADDPKAEIPAAVKARVDGRPDSVRILRNATNMGAAASRNVALGASDADWVLFIDDDVTPTSLLLHSYAAAVESNPGAPGFFGPTRFAPGSTTYQRGVEVCGCLTHFQVASYLPSRPWAPTSNVMVRGDLARAVRFRTIFPKGGGGEDIDYLLRITERVGCPLLAIPDALVDHPWWFNGARDYSRFTRWSYGDSLLHELHPRHAYRTAPNASECLAVGLPVAIVGSVCAHSAVPFVATLVGVPLAELCTEFLRLLMKDGFPSAACTYCIETTLIQTGADLGRLAMQLEQRRWRGFAERWDHMCTGENIGYNRRWSAAKFTMYCLGVGLVAFGFRRGLRNDVVGSMRT